MKCDKNQILYSCKECGYNNYDENKLIIHQSKYKNTHKIILEYE